ncbi:Pimeloyl-ACP methyl ester carboxylesterase [Albimonas donghaensis]|uniref:Palmitoyl-protein thioesterase ABHD10, mitochondrial n=1 Tax=Albimonas donghaensis TaxID=356660 RepID=A0A1H2RCR7_9RHOB|nr:alpha/beta hydrolase [Albimonas donghaensis]SDW17273.1 Pimeloyl-ACP methyl ester carboxylesterase [Albimonas donghaensis]
MTPVPPNDGPDAGAAPEFLTTPDGRRLAYHRSRGAVATAARAAGETPPPGVVFLGGFRSDMTGTKATFLEQLCAERGLDFLRFDYTAHGASSGDFETEGRIGAWARDALDALDALTEGRQVLVGSSMGGWISLLTARARPERVAGLIGIAAAPDFTEDGFWAGFSDAQRAEMTETGRVALPSDYSDEPYVITRLLIEDGRENLVLRAPLPLPFPVRLLQGTADADVPVDWALKLLGHAESPDLRLTLVDGADHRFSEPRELGIIAATLDEVLASVTVPGAGI